MSKKQTFTSEEMLFILREHLKENSRLLKEELTANRKAFVNNQELEHAI
ncbi:MAG: hypothetical protein LBF15_05420 [Candidatus Peribacteria bacterium]|jgi:stress response protein YsnF|nr:hypothetical protein [Candidatus Peribacteria bacterium]